MDVFTSCFILKLSAAVVPPSALRRLRVRPQANTRAAGLPLRKASGHGGLVQAHSRVAGQRAATMMVEQTLRHAHTCLESVLVPSVEGLNGPLPIKKGRDLGRVIAAVLL